jgi:hypothetical protein
MGGSVPRRRLVSRKVSPAIFVAILVAFALPFGTVSCEGPAVEFTGYELATWQVQQTTPPAVTDDGRSLPETIESQASAIAFLMLVSVLTGLVLGIAGRRGAGFATLGGLFFGALLWSRVFDIDSGAEPRGGFELATLLLIALAFWHAVLAIRRRQPPPHGEATGLPPGAVPLGRPWARSDEERSSGQLSQGT